MFWFDDEVPERIKEDEGEGAFMNERGEDDKDDERQKFSLLNELEGIKDYSKRHITAHTVHAKENSSGEEVDKDTEERFF